MRHNSKHFAVTLVQIMWICVSFPFVCMYEKKFACPKIKEKKNLKSCFSLFSWDRVSRKQGLSKLMILELKETPLFLNDYTVKTR